MDNLSNIRIWIVDVDGTLTDGGIYYDEYGNEIKKFCSKDAAGFFSLRALGIKTMVLTGRKCNAVARRVEEMSIDYFEQGIKDKVLYLEEFLEKHDISFGQVAYVGDDCNDFEVMKRCGFKGCPADSCLEIRNIADYVSSKPGGYGAVRDIIEYVLRKQGKWEEAISKIYGIEV